MGKALITVETTIGSDAEKVWLYFTDPKHVVNWNHASDDWHTPTAENDVRDGGYFSYRMEAKDGSFGFNFGGVYHRVIPQSEIVYTLGDGRKVENYFTATASGVVVRVVFEAEIQNDLELQRQGWQAILDHFKAYTEGN